MTVAVREETFDFFVELVSQLFHADVLIAEQAQRIETLEAELAGLRSESGASKESAA